MQRHRFVALRRSRGYSQESLAHRLVVERTTVGRWERGEATPYPHQLPRLAEALEVEPSELDALLGRDTAATSVVEPSDTSRGPTEPWELVDVLTCSSIDRRAVSLMERTIYRYAETYPAESPQTLGPLIHRQLARIRDSLADPMPVAVRRHLVRVLGYAAGLAANVAQDSRQPALADEYFVAAACAAHEAEDDDLAAWVGANHAIAYYASGALTAATSMLGEANSNARSSGPRRRAWVKALHARCLAATGDARAVSLLDESEATLADAPSVIGGTDFFDQVRLEGIRGTSLLWLRHLDEAARMIAAAIDNRPESEAKGRALLTLDLAHCRLLQGEHEEATRLTARGLDMASGNLVQPIASKALDLVGGLRSVGSGPVNEQLTYIEARALEAPK